MGATIGVVARVSATAPAREPTWVNAADIRGSLFSYTPISSSTQDMSNQVGVLARPKLAHDEIFFATPIVQKHIPDIPRFIASCW